MSAFRVTRRLAIAGTAGLLLKPPRVHGASTVNVRRGYSTGRFGQIHYRIAKPTDQSTQTPILCLHSSPNSGRIYETFLGEIGKDRIAVAADTPGFGDSDPPQAAPSIADYAATMGDLIDDLGFDQVDLVGYHTGSMTSVELALQRPRQVRHLVLIAAPIFTKQELANLSVHFAPAELAQDGHHLTDVWQEHVHWAMPGWTLDHVATQFPDAARRPDISWWGHSAAFGYPLADKLPEVRQPTLVLNPEDDLHQQTLRAEGLITNGHIHELPGWGHGFLDIHTQATAALVRDFLKLGG